MSLRQRSEDGRWEWDGQQWVPATQAAPPPRRYWSGRKLAIAAVVVIGTWFNGFAFGVASGKVAPTGAVTTQVTASATPKTPAPLTTPGKLP